MIRHPSIMHLHFPAAVVPDSPWHLDSAHLMLIVRRPMIHPANSGMTELDGTDIAAQALEIAKIPLRSAAFWCCRSQRLLMSLCIYCDASRPLERV